MFFRTNYWTIAQDRIHARQVHYHWTTSSALLKFWDSLVIMSRLAWNLWFSCFTSSWDYSYVYFHAWLFLIILSIKYYGSLKLLLQVIDALRMIPDIIFIKRWYCLLLLRRYLHLWWQQVKEAASKCAHYRLLQTGWSCHKNIYSEKVLYQKNAFS